MADRSNCFRVVEESTRAAQGHKGFEPVSVCCTSCMSDKYFVLIFLFCFRPFISTANINLLEEFLVFLQIQGIFFALPCFSVFHFLARATVCFFYILLENE